MAGDVELIHRDVTEKIIKSFYEVHTALGAGHFEAVYKNAMAVAMNSNGLSYGVEVPYTVFFRGINVGEYRADLVVENAVIVELKSGSKIHEFHQKQTLNYLKVSNLKVGLLMNFGPKAEFERLVLSQTPRRREVSV